MTDEKKKIVDMRFPRTCGGYLINGKPIGKELKRETYNKPEPEEPTPEEPDINATFPSLPAL